jgi:hypothetical protein
MKILGRFKVGILLRDRSMGSQGKPGLKVSYCYKSLPKFLRRSTSRISNSVPIVSVSICIICREDLYVGLSCNLDDFSDF